MCDRCDLDDLMKGVRARRWEQRHIFLQAIAIYLITFTAIAVLARNTTEDYEKLLRFFITFLGGQLGWTFSSTYYKGEQARQRHKRAQENDERNT